MLHCFGTLVFTEVKIAVLTLIANNYRKSEFFTAMNFRVIFLNVTCTLQFHFSVSLYILPYSKLFGNNFVYYKIIGLPHYDKFNVTVSIKKLRSRLNC